jgi:hypothetical protein
MYAFGHHYKEKNLFQAYYVLMVEAIESDDLDYFYQLKEELLEMDNGLEKYLYIMKHVSSSTKAKLPKGK